MSSERAFTVHQASVTGDDWWEREKRHNTEKNWWRLGQHHQDQYQQLQTWLSVCCSCRHETAVIELTDSAYYNHNTLLKRLSTLKKKEKKKWTVQSEEEKKLSVPWLIEQVCRPLLSTDWKAKKRLLVFAVPFCRLLPCGRGSMC